jgi:hypothetical protein
MTSIETYPGPCEKSQTPNHGVCASPRGTISAF